MYETVENAFTLTTVVPMLLAIYTPYFFKLQIIVAGLKSAHLLLLTQFPVRFKV